MFFWSDTETELLWNIQHKTGKYPDLEEMFYQNGANSEFYHALWQRVRDIRSAQRVKTPPQPVRASPAARNEATSEVFNPAEEAYIARMIDRGEM